MTTTNKYNCWTNYATWRVYTDMFDEAKYEHYKDANLLKEFAEAIILIETIENTFARDYAMYFLSEVKWHEIQQAIYNNQLI